MKKLLVVLAIAAIGFASCKKSCVCTGSVTVDGITEQVVEMHVGDMSKSDCEKHVYATPPGATSTVKCKSE
ncbi:MAG: hypothetical protein FWC34_01385 [Bacteroidetes bacterium]|nr:hypothetical protein [Bacteroidota bacterium]